MILKKYVTLNLIDETTNELNIALCYLQSSKFHHDTTIQVSEVHELINRIRSRLLDINLSID